MRVLVCEDDALSREPLTELLRAGGIEADAVAAGSEALRLWRQDGYDVLLLDLCGTGGWELLRQTTADTRAHTLVWTALAPGDLEGLPADVGGVLTKPADLAEIVAALRRVAGKGG